MHIRLLLLVALLLGLLYIGLTAPLTTMADGSDPMPACRGKVCPPLP